MNDGDRFETAMRQIVGKRLTCDELTGKTLEQEPGTQSEAQTELPWEPF